MVCTDVQDYVGPFYKTLFLGASISQFSSQVGWGSTPSQLVVDVVEDKCTPSTAYKVYYDGCGNPHLYQGPDFFNPPKIGSPVYFRYGNFTFAGILRNWKQ